MSFEYNTTPTFKHVFRWGLNKIDNSYGNHLTCGMKMNIVLGALISIYIY